MNAAIKSVMMERIDKALIDITALHAQAVEKKTGDAPTIYKQRDSLLERRKKLQDLV